VTDAVGPVAVSLDYRFEQPFRVSARDAFRWCTDFGPSDGAIFSKKTRRSVRWLGPDTAIMTDTTYPDGAPVRIRRLVRIDAARRAWTNTHLDGPFRFSQYWYRIEPRGARASSMEFVGHRVIWRRSRPGPAVVRRLSEAERDHDSSEWRNYLAPALERDLSRTRNPGRARSKATR